MASKELEKKEVTPAPNPLVRMAEQAKAIATMKGGDQFRQLYEAMGVSPADTEVVSAGKVPFWPAMAGAILVGTIQNYSKRDTKFGECGIYTVLVEERACIGGTLDGEVFEIRPGECISLLERAVLERLQDKIGQRVGVLCLGKTAGKEFDYWDYKVIAQKRPANLLNQSNG